MERALGMITQLKGAEMLLEEAAAGVLVAGEF